MTGTKSVTEAKGVCRYCGCTEDKPCRYLPHPENPPGGQPVLTCKWADKSQTLCTNPALLAKAREEQG
jgi:hypothetical protein